MNHSSNKHLDATGSAGALILLALSLGGAVAAAQPELVPLPDRVFGGGSSQPTTNPIIDLAERVVNYQQNPIAPAIPDKMTLDGDGATVEYQAETGTLVYSTPEDKPMHLVTNEGLDVRAKRITLNMQKKVAALDGPLVLYQDECLVKSPEGATYNWEKEETRLGAMRAKVNGMILRGSSAVYGKDAKGTYLTINDAYISTEDAEEPTTWLGAGTLTVRPGQTGTVSRLSLAGRWGDVPVPILGWFSITHSLNPREGYMPGFGTKSYWGMFLKNSYGILFGNKRTEKGRPTADYLATVHADYRTRRGFALGLDMEDTAMSHKYSEMKGLSTYLLDDDGHDINPTNAPRDDTKRRRYRISLQALYDLSKFVEEGAADWTTVANLNKFSDRHVLTDMFEEESVLEDKPDNTLRAERRTARDQVMLLGRFAPNNFYMADSRAEASYYRTRDELGKTGITYEGRTVASVIRQHLTETQRVDFEHQLANVKDNETREYYTRMLNSKAYARFNSTHEFATSLKVARFLNLTPKVGGAYTGYYGVDGVGADNRFIGYLSCDLDIKLHRTYENFAIEPWGMRSLTHVVNPYATISCISLSSSKQTVPQVDSISRSLGTSTTSPMPMDLMDMSGLDAWGKWSLVRFGLKNEFTTEVDEEQHQLLHTDMFVDYNLDSPYIDNSFGNLFARVSFTPTDRFSVYFDSSSPIFGEGDSYSQYNTGFSYQPFSWLETRLGYRSLKNHPLLASSEQVYANANIRINERYAFGGRWEWDIENNRMPIQQYTIFRHSGPWYIGATLYVRDNGGKKETGFGLSFTLEETGFTLPVKFF